MPNPTTPNNGRFSPRPGDHVDFPVLKGGHTQWVPSTFEQSGKGLIVRVGAAAHYVDANFMEMFNIHYDGVLPDGKRKFTVFLRPLSQRQESRWEVELIMSTETRKSVHKARSANQALGYAVVSWCRENQIPSHKYRVMVSHFQKRDNGYDYRIKALT